MIALPIALGLFGYWVLYSGVKRSSLLDAYRCTPKSAATGTDQSGNISITPVTGGPTFKVTTDCTPKAGDTKIPIPGSSHWFIWRPIGSGIFGQINGQLVGPC